jgi:hypothetical protein
MTDYKFELKRLKSDIEETTKGWSGKNSHVTLGTMSDCVQSWIRSLDRLSAFSELEGPALQEAISACNKAWDNRDNRVEVAKHVGKALRALKQVENEAAVPAKTHSVYEISAKSLYGEAGYDTYVPDALTDLYEIRRKLSGFEIAHSVKSISPRSVEGIIEGLQAIGFRYYSEPVIYATVDRAIKTIQNAHRANERVSRTIYGQAGELIDQLSAQITQYHAPQGYRPPMSRSQAAKFIRDIANVEHAINSAPFNAPLPVIRRAHTGVKSILASLEQFNEPRLRRMASDTIDFLEASFKCASNPSVKAMDIDGWRREEVRETFDLALESLSQLRRNLENI